MRGKKTQDNSNTYSYTEKQKEILEEHIEKYYGMYDKIFKGNKESDLCIDVCIIEPSVERNYYTLVTLGMGAYKMDIPDNIKKYKLERAELSICLPPDWDIDSDDDDNFWALKLLRMIGSLPLRKKSWLSWGHTIDYPETFTKDSELCSVILFHSPYGKNSSVCPLPDGTNVNFYHIVPLCRNELEFKSKFGTEELLQLFGENLPIVSEINRLPLKTENFVKIIDTVEKHQKKIENKKLDVPETNAANHIAAFLMWAFEHDFIDEEFTDYFSEEIEEIKNGSLDIRKFIINFLDGELPEDIFKEDKRNFIKSYYCFTVKKGRYNYPEDVDKSAMKYFGEEKYNCEEFQDEAYLFMPFDKEYLERMYKYIDKAYDFTTNILPMFKFPEENE
ncbi:MAG: suppressor of fused domain protein [Ruminococcus sp.]|nr:suppressor of fused domain protein [Ruminococcus sp.]